MKRPPQLPTDLRKSIATRLKLMRKEFCLTQNDLALRLDIHKSQVSQVERGIHNISLDTLERFINAITDKPIAPEGERYREVVGQRLRNQRKKSGFSQEALGALAGFSVLFVGRVERGDGATSIDQIEHLARVLEISSDDLLNWP